MWAASTSRIAPISAWFPGMDGGSALCRIHSLAPRPSSCIRRIWANGTITRAAGQTSASGTSGNFGPASAARLWAPQGLAPDGRFVLVRTGAAGLCAKAPTRAVPHVQRWIHHRRVLVELCPPGVPLAAGRQETRFPRTLSDCVRHPSPPSSYRSWLTERSSLLRARVMRRSDLQAMASACLVSIRTVFLLYPSAYPVPVRPGGPATIAALNRPWQAWPDGAGGVYIAGGLSQAATTLVTVTLRHTRAQILATTSSGKFSLTAVSTLSWGSRRLPWRALGATAVLQRVLCWTALRVSR